MSIEFSFRYNSSSLRFGLILWQFQNKIFRPMKLVNRYLSWVTVRYDGLVVDLDCLGTAWVEMLGGEVDFSVDGFEMDLEVELTLELVNVKGFFGGGGGGGRGAERTY